MNYLIWGYYGFGNLGDELMLRNIVRKIREKDCEAVIFVRCNAAPDVSDIVPMPIEAIRLPFPLSAIQYLFKLLRILPRIDRVIIGGGTLFLDKGRHSISMLIMAFVAVCAKLFGKKVHIIGVGMDILSFPRNIRYLKSTLNKADSAALRDDFSYTLASYVSPRANFIRSADILFGHDYVSSLTAGVEPRREHIIVSLSDYYKSVHPLENKREQFLAASIAMLVDLIDKCPADRSIALCAFQKGTGEKDYEYLQDIRNRVIEQNPLHAERLQLRHIHNEQQIREVFGLAVCTIGMRFHSLVLSAIFRRPFLGINVEMKIEEICVEFGMPVISVQDFLVGRIDSAAVGALTERQVEEETIRRQGDLAARNFKWLETV